MDQADLLRHLLDAVEGQGLEYGITGSHATMAFGEARLTNDIDVLVALTPPSLRIPRRVPVPGLLRERGRRP